MNHSRRELTKFGLTAGGILLLISAHGLWRGNGIASRIVLGMGCFFVVTGLAYPKLLKPIQRVWLAVGAVMGWIMTRVILTLLFYLVITPLGLAMRLFGKRPLELKFPAEESRTTLWRLRDRSSSTPSSLERQF